VRVEPAGGVVQPAQQHGDGRQRGVGLAPAQIGRRGDLAVDEHEALASVLVDADWCRGALESGVSHRSQEGVDRTRVRTRRAKDMRTDAHHPACVRDPAIELLLSHTATLTDEWCSRPRPVDNGLRATARSDQRRNGSIGSDGSSPLRASATSTTHQLQPASHGPHVREAQTAPDNRGLRVLGNPQTAQKPNGFSLGKRGSRRGAP